MIRILLAVALVLLCSIGAAVLLSGWRPRRQRRQIEADLRMMRQETIEDRVRRVGQ